VTTSELEAARLRGELLTAHLGEVQRRLLTWGLNPKAFLPASAPALGHASGLQSSGASSRSHPASPSRRSPPVEVGPGLSAVAIASPSSVHSYGATPKSRASTASSRRKGMP